MKAQKGNRCIALIFVQPLLTPTCIRSPDCPAHSVAIMNMLTWPTLWEPCHF